MAGFTDFQEDRVLDHIFGTATYTADSNLYVALYTAAPDDAFTVTTPTGTEVSGGAYARVNHNSWDTASSGTTENTGTVTFPTATANWGTVTHFGILNHATTGDLLMWGTVTPSQAVNSGATASFADGAIDITLD